MHGPSYERGELPCPNAGCGGWLRVEVRRDDPWSGAFHQEIVEQDGCDCDPDQLREDYDLGRELQDWSEPDEPRRYDDYADFDPTDTEPEQGLPF